ncbi:MAG: PAS domain-containing protein [Kiritimatiellae bacterium]|nr:PAS domain-containing protein [Kiritimatiellia bacterium]
MSSEFFDKVFDRVGKIDATSLKSQLKRLSGELSMMETVFRSIQEGVMVIGHGGRLIYANGAAERMLSFDASKIKGRASGRFLCGIDWLEDVDWEKAEGRDWSHLLAREIEVTYPQRRVISFYAVPISAPDAPTSSNALVILRDVTAERDREASALEDERLNAVKTLAASVAHEIGNPLNAIGIHLQLLEREVRNLDGDRRDSLGELVGVARAEVKRLDTIITQFLQALRHTAPTLEPGDAVALIGETLAAMRLEIENRRIEVKVTAPEKAPPVPLDPGQIKQVFYNIVKNAMEAMPDGGRLDISVSSGDAFLRIDFADNGVGIPEDALGRIFDAYHTTKAKGTGLGLMIVKRIVEAHGGQIEVSSRQGQGTRFRILLPLLERRIRKLKA